MNISRFRLFAFSAAFAGVAISGLSARALTEQIRVSATRCVPATSAAFPKVKTDNRNPPQDGGRIVRVRGGKPTSIVCPIEDSAQIPLSELAFVRAHVDDRSKQSGASVATCVVFFNLVGGFCSPHGVDPSPTATGVRTVSVVPDWNTEAAKGFPYVRVGLPWDRSDPAGAFFGLTALAAGE